MFNSRPWKRPRLLNLLSRTPNSLCVNPALKKTSKGCDAYRGLTVPDNTAFLNADTTTLSATLAPEAEPVDLNKVERVANDMTQPKESNGSKVSSTAADNPLAQRNSPNDYDIKPNKKHRHKHKIDLLKSANHALWAKLRSFRDAKKLHLWNWKGEGQKELTTEPEKASTPRNATSDATTEFGSSDGDTRRDWEVIRAIPDDKFRHLLLRCLNKSGEDPIPLRACHVVKRLEGGFHLAVVLYVYRHGEVKPWIIKVPAHGTTAFWTKEDAYMMRREVEIMRQISCNTAMHVPKIENFYTGLDDELGAPWILMEKLPGRPAYEIWFDEPYNRNKAYLKADSPTAETHRRRVNFLKSLASQMVQLQCLEFDQIGMPKINHAHDVTHGSSSELEQFPYTLGPSYHWPYSSNITEVVERGPFSTIQGFIQSAFQASFDPEMLRKKYPELNEKYYMKLGIRKIMEVVFSTAAFTSGDANKTFVVHHNDLDLQNILTDKDGNITGIIDWDGAFVGPRCIGPAAAPRFLTRDWFPDGYGEQLEKLPHMAWNTHRYRKIYAAAMYKAELKNGTSRDAQYTVKSGIYAAALCAIYEGGNCWDFTDKLLLSLPEFRMDPYNFKVLLGRGFPAAEEMLEHEIAKLCEPTLPGEEYLKELDKDIITNTVPDLMESMNDTVELPTPDEALNGTELSQGSQAETSTTINVPDLVPGESKEPQTVLLSPSPILVQEDDDETQSLAELRSIFSQKSLSDKSSPCSSLGFEEGGHLQGGPQLQPHSNVKQDIIKIKVSIPNISHILYRTV